MPAKTMRIAKPYRVEVRDVGNGQTGRRVVGPEISEYWADATKAAADVEQLNAAYLAGFKAGPVADLLEVAEAFVSAYSADGEFNTHTAEHSPKDLRRMAQAAMAKAKKVLSLSAENPLRLIAQWWADGGASLNPDALLGESEKSIRVMVEESTGIRRE